VIVLGNFTAVEMRAVEIVRKCLGITPDARMWMLGATRVDVDATGFKVITEIPGMPGMFTATERFGGGVTITNSENTGVEWDFVVDEARDGIRAGEGRMFFRLLRTEDGQILPDIKPAWWTSSKELSDNTIAALALQFRGTLIFRTAGLGLMLQRWDGKGWVNVREI
jgi:hypothetical protein